MSEHSSPSTETAALLSTEALAARWGSSTGHLANLRAKGLGLPYLKFGSAVRYRLCDVEAVERGDLPEVATEHLPVGGAA